MSCQFRVREGGRRGRRACIETLCPSRGFGAWPRVSSLDVPVVGAASGKFWGCRRVVRVYGTLGVDMVQPITQKRVVRVVAVRRLRRRGHKGWWVVAELGRADEPNDEIDCLLTDLARSYEPTTNETRRLGDGDDL